MQSAIRARDDALDGGILTLLEQSREPKRLFRVGFPAPELFLDRTINLNRQVGCGRFLIGRRACTPVQVVEIENRPQLEIARLDGKRRYATNNCCEYRHASCQLVHRVRRDINAVCKNLFRNVESRSVNAFDCKRANGFRMPP